MRQGGPRCLGGEGDSSQVQVEDLTMAGRVDPRLSSASQNL